jgi:dATP pyrophosphohydrolase
VENTPRYKIPESVLVVVYSQKGEVLLLQRTDPADFWQSVTGSLQHGETLLQAAQRELIEETGFEPDGLRDCDMVQRFPIHPAWRKRYAPDVTHNTEHVFALELVEPRTPVLNPHEHQAYIWLPRENAAEKASSWTNREAILACVPVNPDDMEQETT